MDRDERIHPPSRCGRRGGGVGTNDQTTGDTSSGCWGVGGGGRRSPHRARARAAKQKKRVRRPPSQNQPRPVETKPTVRRRVARRGRGRRRRRVRGVVSDSWGVGLLYIRRGEEAESSRDVHRNRLAAHARAEGRDAESLHDNAISAVRTSVSSEAVTRDVVVGKSPGPRAARPLEKWRFTFRTSVSSETSHASSLARRASRCARPGARAVPRWRCMRLESHFPRWRCMRLEAALPQRIAVPSEGGGAP